MTTMPPREISAACLSDKLWRMNNLYVIQDKEGRAVPFHMNEAQQRLWDERHPRMVILKARQAGYTTFIDLMLLDECLFNPNTEAGIIAHTKDDASKIFRRKIQFPYNNLPTSIRRAIPLITDSKTELAFDNGSVISVGTSMRSGTLQLLHISEFGKVCAKWPEKAQEIVTGALPAVAPSGAVFIESTAEGRSGYFFDYCKAAQDKAKSGAKLTPLDYAFHFHPWWLTPEYVLPAHGVPIIQRLQDYFKEVEAKIGRKFSPEQEAWYAKTEELLGEDMKREYPSTPEEAFEQSIQGAYFSQQFTAARQGKRICSVPIQAGIAVDTDWDLGMDDTTVIWFSQTVGREVHLVDYYEANGEGLEHYARVLKERGYHYGRHYAPHDINVRELGTGKTRFDTARDLGIKFDLVPRVKDKADAIEAARNILSVCWFDAEKCDQGIVHLESYRKEWDHIRGCYKDHPLHDIHSNAADAFQTLAMRHPLRARPKAVAKPVVRRPGRWA